jgi:hypothetical protein
MHMKELIATYPLVAWSIVSVLLATLVIVSLWEKVRWWWFNTWVSFPFIGRIARLSHDRNEDTAYPGWFSGERTLCQEYKSFVHIQDEHDFNEKITYLTKAGDNGRSETPKWIWLLTVCMVFVEAMGFAYVLAGYTLPGASENLQQTGAYGIAFLISVILVAFTHMAGRELYKSERIKNARREWVEDKRQHKLCTGTIPLARPQSQDDGMPTYTQLTNRVGSHPSNKIFALTIVFVILVACLATYVRGQVLERELDARITQSSAQAGLAAQSSDASLDMSAEKVKLPDADAAANSDADKKVVSEEANIDRHGGWATFIVLAFVFVFLQILGIIFGYRWDFAGENSAEAFRDIGKGRYSSYAAVRDHYRKIADTAQARLAVLQQRIMSRNGDDGISGQHLSKTFRDYIQETRIADAADRAHERVHTNAAREQDAIAAATVMAQPAARGLPFTSVEQVLAALDRLGADKDAKKNLVSSLPADLSNAVRAALKVQKEEKERKAREADELEDLL